jgi:hypothetical protein
VLLCHCHFIVTAAPGGSVDCRVVGWLVVGERKGGRWLIVDCHVVGWLIVVCVLFSCHFFRGTSDPNNFVAALAMIAARW